MNQELILEFQKLINHTENELSNKPSSGLKFKLLNFRKTLKIIENYPNKINSGEELKEYCINNGIKGIGSGTINRINEILQSGKLDELSEINTSNNEIDEINKLLRVTGIGPSNAKKMFKKGLTLQKLLNNEDDCFNDLTHHQQIGIKYFEDFEKKIPRKEILSLQKKISQIIKKLDSKFDMHICGSFRREKLESGDIDILITHDDIKYDNDINYNYLPSIIETLENKKILIDNLTSNGNTKYMGVCKNSPKGKARRIDIRLIPKKSLGCALLYFTGSGNFNVNMRKYALSKGYSINEYALIKKKDNKNIIIQLENEHEIFKILNLSYVEPKDRLSDYKFTS